jgi:hypothetical protein
VGCWSRRRLWRDKGLCGGCSASPLIYGGPHAARAPELLRPHLSDSVLCVISMTLSQVSHLRSSGAVIDCLVMSCGELLASGRVANCHLSISFIFSLF